MKAIQLIQRVKFLSMSLLLCWFNPPISVQGQTVNGWISTATSGSSRNMSVTGNWALGRTPLAGDVLVFGYNNTPGVGANGGRQPINNLTNWSTFPVSLVFSNTDGWRLVVTGYTNKFTLAAGGVFQDASVTNTAPAGTAPVGQNQFYNYFELSANASIVNNSIYSLLSFRQDGTMFASNNFFCLDNKGYTLTIDGPGTNTFTTPSAGSHAGGAIKGSGVLIKNGTGLTSLSSSNAYTGPTMVNAGQLAIYTYSYGGGSYGVSNNASLNVRVASSGSTLNTSSLSLTNATGAANTNTLILNLSTLGNPTTPVIYATNFTVAGTVYVTVNGSGLSPGTIPLIQYNGSINGGGSLVTNSIPSGVAAYLTNNTSAHQIQLVVSSVPNLLWTGKTNNVLANIWDIGVTTNWNDTSALQPTAFLNGLPV